MKTHYKFLLSAFLLSIIFLSLKLFDKPIGKVLKANDEQFCNLCIFELKKNFYRDYEFERYLKTISWIETVKKKNKFFTTEYEVTLKNPEFKFRNRLYYDQNLDIFFHPLARELPVLVFNSNSMQSENFNEALLIKNSIDGIKQIEYSKISGWTIYVKAFVVRLGKDELDKRLIKLNNILSDFEKNNLGNKILDLRYQNGFSAAQI